VARVAKYFWELARVAGWVDVEFLEHNSVVLGLEEYCGETKNCVADLGHEKWMEEGAHFFFL